MPANSVIASAPRTLPGQYIRDTILKPKKMSVTEAAKILGLGRPALSNFLNGKAAASPDMAARIERAFGIPAQKILDLQAAFDATEAKSRGAGANAKAYVPPFLAIKANEIENWAASNISARIRLSVFLRTLVHSTGVGLSKVDFPGNDDAERAGWDGFVTAGQGTPWIPEGQSGWEFGVNENVKAKADGDYAQRTKTTDKEVREQITFVFVTPRSWPGKAKWEKDRHAEAKWKNVRAIDASDMEQWLEESIAAQTWFACETHRPTNGVQSLDRCWADWANTSDPPLVGTLFSTAVRNAKDFITSRLSQSANEPIIIAADSSEEALAFLSQLFSEASGEELLVYRDRVAVFRETGTLPKLAAGSSSFIAVALTRDVERELAPYSRSIRSIVIYPRNATNAEPNVVLEPLNYEAFRTSLEEMKFGRDEIDRLGHESGRSLTVLRRRLSRVPAVSTPAWAANADTAARLTPFLLAGAWNSTNQSDQTVLALLAGGAEYSALEKEFQSHARLDDAPVWSVGTYRGVVSKIDLLFAIATSITDLKIYFDVAYLVLSEKDPALDLPEEDQWKAGVFGKTREISAALRRGISETLVLLAVHGNTLFQSRLGMNVKAAAAALVKKLLTPLTTRVLEDHERDLPTYAEAAPETFLEIIEEDLRGETPAAFGLMRPANSDIFGRCVRTGLLWALENLAWSPSTLPRVVNILARLATIQIDDNWVNKPIGSLESIFRSWMPQTAASLEQRMLLMEKLAEQHPKIAWQICMDQLETHGVGHYSHKPQWRNDGHGYGEPVRIGDARTFVAKVVDIALKWKQHDRMTLGDVVTKLYMLSEAHQNEVWQLVRNWAKSGANDEDKAWVREKIRVTIMSRRGRAHGKELAEKLAEPARAAYEALEPSDLFAKHEWLFRQVWVEESADELEEEPDYQKRHERIAELRRSALNAILQQRGIGGILEFAELGKAAFQIGEFASELLHRSEVAAFLLAALPAGTDSWTRKNLVSGTLNGLSDADVRTEILRDVKKGVPEEDFARILALAPFHGPTWALVDELEPAAQKVYWDSVLPGWNHQNDTDLNDAVERLIKAKRPRAAFHCTHFELKKIKPTFLFQLLHEIAVGEEEQPGQYQLDSYYIAEAFRLLDASGEFTVDQLAGLEFPYIEALSRNYGSREARGVPNLERYLEGHPELFVEAVAWTYKRNDGKDDPEDLKLNDSTLLRNRAERGWKLLDNIERIPGHDKLGKLDPGLLLVWIETVRKSCADLGRSSVCDISIGKLLSNAPQGEDGVWPCEAVREALERLQVPDISRGITTGLYNSRGVHWRGEGGGQEREIAQKYRKWADALELSHPFVASIHRHMAETYEHEAKGQDVEARIERRLR